MVKESAEGYFVVIKWEPDPFGQLQVKDIYERVESSFYPDVGRICCFNIFSSLDLC